MKMKVREVLRCIRSRVSGAKHSNETNDVAGGESFATKHTFSIKNMVKNLRVDAIAAALICFVWMLSFPLALGASGSETVNDAVTEVSVAGEVISYTVPGNDVSDVDDKIAEEVIIDTTENDAESVVDEVENIVNKSTMPYVSENNRIESQKDREAAMAMRRQELENNKNSVQITIEYSGISSWRLAVVREALRHIGNLEYSWGGEDLIDGSDCSGYVYAVYAACGLQQYFGGRSSCNDIMQRAYNGQFKILEHYEGALPGDIIVYYSDAACNNFDHCGLYVGDGKIAHMNGRAIGCDISNVRIRSGFCQYEVIRALVPDDTTVRYGFADDAIEQLNKDESTESVADETVEPVVEPEVEPESMAEDTQESETEAENEEVENIEVEVEVQEDEEASESEDVTEEVIEDSLTEEAEALETEDVEAASETVEAEEG